MTDSTNLDLVRSIYADWERGDFGRIDWADPEIEYVNGDGPQPGPWTGVVSEGWRDFFRAYEEYRVEADEYLELDDERVLVLHHRSGRAKASGLDLAQLGSQGANLFYIRGEKVAMLVLYWNRDRALADLGLKE